MTDPQLIRWQRILDMPLQEAGAAVGFVDRLIKETGWTRHFALGAVDEYRRFLFLAAEAGHPVSPSPAVDEVWHLHLLSTRSYWDVLCKEILGFPLHHDPATGTRENRARLNDAYARTLASYARLFSEQPPQVYWPTTPTTLRFHRIDPARTRAIPIQLWRVLITLSLLSVGTIVALILWVASLSNWG
jgi:hypothetical protein